MNNPKEIIEKSIKRIEDKYHNELTKIDTEIERVNYTGGNLTLKLDFAFVNELLPTLNKIYKLRGWDRVVIFNDFTGKKTQTVIELEYNEK